MESIVQHLKKQALPLSLAYKTLDYEEPLSFQDWKKSRTSIIPTQEYILYNQYLSEWYFQKKKINSNKEEDYQIKLNYLSLLKELQLFFSNTEKEKWYSVVNFNDINEVLKAIPYFAKKLKEIALFYINTRKKLKNTKLQYNLGGTNTGVELEVQEQILNNYSKTEFNTLQIPEYIFNNIPELDSIKGTLVVKVEEIYDDFEYQDQSTNVDLSKYYDFNDFKTQEFFNTKGLVLSSDKWVFTNTPKLSEEYFDYEYNLNLAESYLNKYTGFDVYEGENATIEVQKDIYDVSIEKGDNYFVWPYGAYKLTSLLEKKYQAIPLSSTSIESFATAGETIESSDIVFVETKNNVQGAWLKLQKYNIEQKTLKAKFEKKLKTEFRFPYPGYGLSGIGMEWSGPSIEYLPEYTFLKDEYKVLVENMYWNFDNTTVFVSSIPLQNTTLIQQKAYPSKNYLEADKITVKNISPYTTESVYSGVIEKAWLYKFTNTDIPIKPNEQTLIYWPYERVRDTIPNYYPEASFICNPLKIENIKPQYTIASSTFEGADKIYKLKNINDTIETATECAWLSSNSMFYTYSNIIAPLQLGLSVIAYSGIATKFIWQGDNLTDINDVFKHVKHQSSCPLAKDSNLKYFDFNKCDCGSVKFNPFGHPGESIEDNFNLTDVILECTDYTDIDTVDIAKWRDKTGNTYKQSLNFAWFKTVQATGFNNGKWVTEIPNGIPRLKKGGIYSYIRAKLIVPDNNLSELPPYVLRHPYKNIDFKKFTWIGASKKNDNSWVSTNEPSEMVVRERDLLLYERKQSVISAVSGTQLIPNTIAENTGNIWANNDFLTIVNPKDQKTFISQTVYINYPNVNYVDPVSASVFLNNGTPPINSSDVLSIKSWTLIDPTGNKKRFENANSFSFTPLIEGEYRVEVEILSGKPESYTRVSSAVLASATNTFLDFGPTPLAFYQIWNPETTITYLFTGIPPITAVNYLQNITSLTGISTPQPGFVLNVDLYGWDYNTNFQRNVSVPGARPFWAKSYTGRNEQTRFGGAPDWGAPAKTFDDHNIIFQPDISEIVLETGQYIEYERKGSTNLLWEQPLLISTEINKTQWCDVAINYNDTLNLNVLGSKSNLSQTLTITPLSTHSSIELTNIVDNEPVSILYKAFTPFVWSITAIPEIPAYVITEKDINKVISVDRPWNQFANRFNSSVSQIPTLEDIYTKKDLGGYFTPNNLGMSVYNSKDFTYSLSTSARELTSEFTTVEYFFGGRGNTKTDNVTPYTKLVEDTTWLKEPSNTGSLAGNINRQVTKEYPKFIPYQSSTESKINKQSGINNLNNKLSPWSGNTETTWGDNTSNPGNTAGLSNANEWAEQHILQSTDKRIYNWCSDIYGNQYVLLKNIKDVLPYEQKDITGELWVQKTSKIVEPAYKALKDVFDTYKGLSLYSELTGNGIKKIDIFFDTLYIETTSAVLFEKLNYDYDVDDIFSFVDSSHIVSLASPVTIGLKREFNKTNTLSENENLNLSTQVGDTWFFPEQKIVLLSICELSGNEVKPHLYELDISNETFSKVFPI